MRDSYSTKPPATPHCEIQKKVSEDVEEYLQSGGVIEKIETGVTAFDPKAGRYSRAQLKKIHQSKILNEQY